MIYPALIIAQWPPARLFFLGLRTFLVESASLTCPTRACRDARFRRRLALQQQIHQLLTDIGSIPALVAELLAVKDEFALAIDTTAIASLKPPPPASIEILAARR